MRGLFFVAGGFFFAGQLIAPDVVAQAQFGRRGLGLAFADLAALVQEFLNKRIIGGFFGNMFHEGRLASGRVTRNGRRGLTS